MIAEFAETQGATNTAVCEDGSQFPGVTSDGTYECNYVAVYHLMSHSEDMLPEDLFQYTLVRRQFVITTHSCRLFQYSYTLVRRQFVITTHSCRLFQYSSVHSNTVMIHCWHVLHCVSKKVPTFKLSVTLSNLNRFSKFLHCGKAYEICYKTHITLPTSP